MHRPPGYYRDEKGREYYWDGQHRSYIPQTSWERINRDVDHAVRNLDYVVFGVLKGLGLVIGIALGLILVGFLIDTAFSSLSNFLILVAVVAGLVFLVVRPNYAREMRERHRSVRPPRPRGPISPQRLAMKYTIAGVGSRWRPSPSTCC